MKFEKFEETTTRKTVINAKLSADEPIQDSRGRTWLPEVMTVEINAPREPTWSVLVRRVTKSGELGESVKRITFYSGYEFGRDVLRSFAHVADQVVATITPDPVVTILAELQSKHGRFVEQIADLMPECWGDTEYDVVNYVRSLSGGGNGHSADCDCF